MSIAKPFNTATPLTAANISMIRSVRRFNRFYTNILGLLDQHMPGIEFSLSEARVLYEIGSQEQCTSKSLITELNLDPGYLSRMVKRFEKLGLTCRKQSAVDRRLYFLSLTPVGKDTLGKLDERSNQQVWQLIGHLQDAQQKGLVEEMKAIEFLLSGKTTTISSDTSTDVPVSIRSELRPGDIGTLIHLHGWIYAKECNYNHIFEGYVCKTFYEFFEKYSPDKDCFWFAETGKNIVGAIGIVGHTVQKAQLRWFILHPDFRGKGLGKKLMELALTYCKEKGYRKVFLETTEDQKTAIRMYEKAGFRKIAEHENYAWGVEHAELTYELDLSKATDTMKN